MKLLTVVILLIWSFGIGYGMGYTKACQKITKIVAIAGAGDQGYRQVQVK